MSTASRFSSRAILAVAIAVLAGCAAPARHDASRSGGAIRIGAVFPAQGMAGVLAGHELAGVRVAADLVNADGGIGGRPIELFARDLESGQDAPAVMSALANEGISVVVGSYSSDLSIAASAAADATGLLYWEAGAVADRLTGRGLPMVFRVGASGSNLGANSAEFAASELASRLGRTPSTLRTALAAARPDVVILASHIPDGIAFRRAMLGAGLHVGALIGSTMAECDPDFAGELGSDAVGIFASDRPTGGFDPNALTPAARAVYDRFAAAWQTIAASPSASGADSDGGSYNRSGSEYGG